MKKFISLLLSLCIIITLFTSISVNAEITTIASGNCGDNGDNVTWSLVESGYLRISGNGNMKDYKSYEDRPWDKYLIDGTVKSVEVSNGVTSICDYAFQNGKELERVNISDVERIGINPFAGCIKLEYIDFDPWGKNYCTDDGVLFNKAKTTLIAYPAGNKEDIYAIPSTVTTIATKAFDSCKFTSLVIPASVIKIEDDAFYATNDITDIYYKGTENEWNKIDVNYGRNQGISKSYNNKLTIHFDEQNNNDEYSQQGYLENNIKWSLDENGTLKFDGTGQLCAGGSIRDEYPWGNVNNIKKVIIGEGITSIEYYSFNNYENLESIIFPSTLRKIYNDSFYNLKKINRLVIPEGVTHIYGDCFENCTSLSDITIPSTIKLIGHGFLAESAFMKDKNNWEDGVLYCNDVVLSTFYNRYCNGKDFYDEEDEFGEIYRIKDGVRVVTADAFQNTDIKTVYIPQSVKIISGYVLLYVKNAIFEGDIPETFSYGSWYPFWGVHTITYYPKNNETWTESSMADFENECSGYNGCSFIPYSDINEVDTNILTGKCGENATWTLNRKENKLLINGSGDMYASVNDYMSWNNYIDNQRILTVIIEDGVTSISDYAFCGTKIKTYIPSSMKKIGHCGISGKYFFDVNEDEYIVIYYNGTEDEFKNIEFGEDNEYSSIYYNTDKPLKGKFVGEYLYDYEIPGDISWELDADGTLTVTGNGDIPFFKLAGLYTEDDTEYINDHSLEVKKLDIKEGITGIRGFTWYENLTEVNLPKTLKNIADYTFTYTAINTINIPESVINIGEEIVNETPFFKNSDNWENGCLYKDGWLLANDGSFNKNEAVVKDGTVGIAGGVFSNKEIEKIVIPNSLKYLGHGAFDGCYTDTVIIPKSVTSIGSNVFFFSHVNKLYVPSSITSIDKSAFAYSNFSDIYYEGTEQEWNSIYNNYGYHYDERPTIEAAIHYSSYINVATTLSDGGSVVGAGNYANGEMVFLKAIPNSGYSFDGWYADGNLISNNQEYNFTAEKNIILEAKFNKISSSRGGGGGTLSYTIKLNTNGGNELKNISVKKGQTIGTIESPKKTGFVFDGWYSDKECTKAYDKDTKVTDSTTLYAGWKVDPVRQIVLTIGKKEATVWNEGKSNDVAPVIRNDRTMLPARFVAENLGATVEWVGEEQKVVITRDDIVIVLYIDSDKAYVNNEEVTLDSPAFIENDRTYTPLRFIAEKLGADVDWDGDTQEVTITK